MCFYHESEWTAMVQEEADTKADEETKCDECHGVIPVGAFLHTLHQQEYEECHACERGDCECSPDGGKQCCQCSNPDFGETFDYEVCRGCHLLLQAIEKVEEEAGCKGSETRPSLSGMMEELSEGSKGECKKYFKRAKAMFDDPVFHRWLLGMWRRIWRKS